MVDHYIYVSRSYSTSGSEKKLLVDKMNASNSSTTKTRRLKKVVIVKVENVEVVEIGEGEYIDPDLTSTTEKKKKRNSHCRKAKVL